MRDSFILYQPFHGTQYHIVNPLPSETFSTGLNMPAKTVVFTNVRKFDGGCFRWVTSGEYIQMSGRAGRRGLDDRGECEGSSPGRSLQPFLSQVWRPSYWLFNPALTPTPIVHQGIVILMLDAKMESGVAKEMIKGAPDNMYSEFHLGYNMLLGLLRIEGSEPEELMAKSFRQFQVGAPEHHRVIRLPRGWTATSSSQSPTLTLY